MLVAAGCGISDLRKLNISPADIRLAGFTMDQMSVHLGVDRLKEAGFTLQDFLNAGSFSLNDLVRSFPVEDIVKSKKFTLEELMKCISPSDLRTYGYTAKDFVSQLGCNSVTLLKQYGFTNAEIASAGLSTPAPPSQPLSYQPPNAKRMSVGETWTAKRTGDASTFLEVMYTRVDAATASGLLSHPHPDNGTASNYPYDGSGKSCPRCGRSFVLLEKYCSSDGMCGVERGAWVCDDANCGMKKTERYEGYSSIF